MNCEGAVRLASDDKRQMDLGLQSRRKLLSGRGEVIKLTGIAYAAISGTLDKGLKWEYLA